MLGLRWRTGLATGVVGAVCPRAGSVQFQLARGMAGHSKWANIRHKKEKNDKQKAAVSTKMARAIVTAVKQTGDPNPQTNYMLDVTVRRAHKMGVSNAVIEKAIASASGHHNAGDLHHVTYEGSGPCGVLFIVEALTDNKNRTAPAIRHIFRAYGGHLEAKTADFAFERRGYMEVDVAKEKVDGLLEVAMENGAVDFTLPENEREDASPPETNENSSADATEEAVNVKLYCDPKDLLTLSKHLKDASFAVSHERIIRHPLQTVHVEDEDTAETLHKLMDALDENEDVSEVYHNIG